MNALRWITAAALLVLAGCATVPEPLQGEYSQSFYPDQATERSLGGRVRWGGMVVETVPEADRTCVELLARELDSSARPRTSDTDHGRFLACRDEFLDPEIFTNGREVTVTGRLDSFRVGKVGEFEYRYPVVDARTVYLWPERLEHDWYGYGYYGWGYPYYWPYYHHYPFFYTRYVIHPRPYIHGSGGTVRRTGDGGNKK